MLLRSLLLATIAAPCLVAAAQESGRRPESRDPAGVLAAADDWIAAERMRNVAALGRRLTNRYRDYDADGRSHSKTELLDHAATRKDIWPGTADDVARAFHAKYPSRKEVVIEGDTAIISYHPVDPTRSEYVVAEDTFTYQDGMWRGVMSSHFRLDTPVRS
jgi:hypothetical protein